MCSTSHTVRNQSGSAESVSISHDRCRAIQYDFYIPAEIWDAAPVQTFRTRLLDIVPDATIFNGLTGIWEGTAEQTRIYRMIVPAARFQRNNVTNAFRSEIGRLMAELVVTPQTQQAFMYTETEIEMNLSTR